MTTKLPLSTISKSAMSGTGVYQPRSILDWLQRMPGGGPAADLNYGYFGPQSSIIRKDITTAGDTFVGTDFFTNTFGAKVWDSLNSQTRLFNLIRKVAWGNTTGYRIRSGRNTSTQPVSETAALPTIDKPDLQTIFVQPGFIVTSLGVSALAQFLGTLEGGIGDALAVAQESAMIDHVKRINQMLTASNNQRVVAGASGNSNVTVVDATWASVGDVFREAGQSQDIVCTVGGLALTLQFDQTTTTDRILYTRSRAGIYSVDDVVQQTGLHINGSTFSGAEAGGYGNLVVADRDPLAWNAGNVFESGDASLRHLSTGMIDQAIDTVRRNGGEPDLIATGIEQLTRLGTILQANQHFIGEGTFQVKQGGEGTLLGYPTGFQVATYKGIPCWHDFDIATSYQQAATGDAKRGANAYVLDTRFIEMPVLFTTQYLESRDYLQNNMLGVKGIFLTALQTRCYDFRKQSKISDLSDGINLT
jgi:hypothetical protein